MAYNFTKLSETPIVESTKVTPNILVEDNGDIKRISADRISANQINADWNETDSSSPAFIMNKPESLGGGGANIVTYTMNSGSIMLNGSRASAQNIIDEWNNGSILRLESYNSYSQILSIDYTVNSGSINGTITYSSNGSLATANIY